MATGPVEIPDAEHELVIERVAAIDVAKAAGRVCVRLPGKTGRRFSRVWDVPARTGAITELGDHLIESGIEKVTVESTSDYWRVWYYLLAVPNALDVKRIDLSAVVFRLKCPDEIICTRTKLSLLTRPDTPPPINFDATRHVCLQPAGL